MHASSVHNRWLHHIHSQVVVSIQLAHFHATSGCLAEGFSFAQSHVEALSHQILESDRFT